MVRKRVGVVEPEMVLGGGTEAVTAWTIEALKRDFDVTLITYSQVDGDALNRFYGTRLLESDFSIIHPSLPPLLGRTSRLALLKDHLMMGYCKSVSERFDVFIAVGTGMDFGRKGIQYIAYGPGSNFVKVRGHEAGMPLWYYLLKRSFMRFCEVTSRFSEDRLKNNITLATSGWTGKLLTEMYGLEDYQVVFPPVYAPSSGTQWSMRQDGFLCIARIVPEKMIDEAVEILKRVRDRGFDVSFHIVGRPDDPDYYRKIQKLSEENSSWVLLDGVMPKQELFSLMDRYKYGINPALGEPSGVAALEMVKAGCIVFMRGGGGLPEIVDVPELTYEDVDDAVSKITEVLGGDLLQKSVLERLETRGEGLSTEAFSLTMERVVNELVGGRDAASTAG